MRPTNDREARHLYRVLKRGLPPPPHPPPDRWGYQPGHVPQGWPPWSSLPRPPIRPPLWARGSGRLSRSSRPSSSRSRFRRWRRRLLVWEARLGRWLYYRLPPLRLAQPTGLPPEVEILALRVLLSALLLLLLAETVMLVLVVSGFQSQPKP